MNLLEFLDQTDKGTNVLGNIVHHGSTVDFVNIEGRSGVAVGIAIVQPEVAASAGGGDAVFDSASSSAVVVGDEEDATGILQGIPLGLGEDGTVRNGSCTVGEDDQTGLVVEAEGDHGVVVVGEEVVHLLLGEGTPAVVGAVASVSNFVVTPLAGAGEFGSGAVTEVVVSTPNLDTVANQRTSLEITISTPCKEVAVVLVVDFALVAATEIKLVVGEAPEVVAKTEVFEVTL